MLGYIILHSSDSEYVVYFVQHGIDSYILCNFAEIGGFCTYCIVLVTAFVLCSMPQTVYVVQRCRDCRCIIHLMYIVHHCRD